MGYYDFGRGFFEDKLSELLKRNGLGRWYDVTDRMKDLDMLLYERVYLVSTRDRNRSILVYSTLDTRTDRVSDGIGIFVRFYIVENVLGGHVYRSVGRRIRNENIFTRMEGMLVRLDNTIVFDMVDKIK